jgi:hypothetical protein
VLLNSGARAIVLRAGAQAERPLVRVVRNAEGAPIPHDEQPLVDLSAREGAALAVERLLSGSVDPGPAGREAEESPELVSVEADPAAGD